MNKPTPTLKCPRCGLVNDPDALRCDCGFDFGSQTLKEPYDLDRAKASASPAGIVGCILALLGALMAFFFVTTRSFVAVPSRLLTPGNPFNFLWVLFFAGLVCLAFVLYNEHTIAIPKKVVSNMRTRATPNQLVPQDRNPRERGFRPVNSDR